MDLIFQRIGNKWYLKWQFVRDIYFLMCNDIRFYSPRSSNGIRYAKVSKYLKDSYDVHLTPSQLKYLVRTIKIRK